MIATASLAFAVLAAAHDPTPESIRSAVGRALPALRRAATTHAEERACFACHNQAHPMLAFTAARRLGFELDPEFVRAQIKHIRGFVADHRYDWAEFRGTGGHVDTAGWLLATFAAAGEKPDTDTAAIARYVLRRHADRKHWTVSSTRPPTQASSFTTSWLAVRSLKDWGAADDRDAIGKRIAAARDWARSTDPKDTEDRVYRLRLLRDADAEAADVAAAAKDLLAHRNPDGSWAQLPDRPGDAYATATALAALAETGTLAPETIDYRRGVAFLLRAQRDDGTWRVATRAKPIQPYFEAGYPYGKDQFISSSAAAWAVVALGHTAPR
jgi:hypothetical protein